MKTNKSLQLILLLMAFFGFKNSLLAQNPGQVIIYKDAEYKGESKTYDYSGIKSEGQYQQITSLPWNDAISSIKVGKGIKVHLYRDSHGGSNGSDDNYLVLYEGSCVKLLSYNDAISSMRIYKVNDNTPLTKFYYDGTRASNDACQTLGPGDYKSNNLLQNDAISGITNDSRLRLVLYKDNNFSGSALNFDKNNDNGNLGALGFNDAISSIKVILVNYAILDVIFSEGVSQKSGASQLGTSQTVSNKNNNSSATMRVDVSTTFDNTITTSWSNTTTLGLSVTKSWGVEAEVPGGGSASSSTSITASIENSFQFGKETSKSKGATIAGGIDVEVPAGSTKKVTMIVQPMKMLMDVTYVYAPIIDETKKVTNDDPNTWIKVTEKLEIDYFNKTDIRIEDISTTSNSNSLDNKVFYIQTASPKGTGRVIEGQYDKLGNNACPARMWDKNTSAHQHWKGLGKN